MIDTIYEHHIGSDPVDDMEYEETIPEANTYQYRFPDGSLIVLDEGEYPEIQHPYRNISRLWQAEEVCNLADVNEWLNDDIINFIRKNYPQ